jgi:hypothetical protein
MFLLLPLKLLLEPFMLLLQCPCLTFRKSQLLLQALGIRLMLYSHRLSGACVLSL